MMIFTQWAKIGLIFGKSVKLLANWPLRFSRLKSKQLV